MFNPRRDFHSFLFLRVAEEELPSSSTTRRDRNKCIMASAGLIRMLLEGAAIVRFASPFLDALNEKKDFVFITIFIEEDGTATLFQQ